LAAGAALIIVLLDLVASRSFFVPVLIFRWGVCGKERKAKYMRECGVKIGSQEEGKNRGLGLER
jgi:hypothetical protein